MKKTYIASDLHLIPGEEVPPVAVKFAELAKQERAQIVFAGDMFDVLPWGNKAWETTAGVFTLNDFKRIFPYVVYVRGNHDPGWLQEFTLGNNLILHGHQFTEWVILQHFAPSLVEFMVKHFPSQWHAFSKRMNWIPSVHRTDIPGKELDKYHSILNHVWALALSEAQKRGVRIIMGHTHHVATLIAGAEVWDCGDLRQGSYIRISQKNVISRGWVKGCKEGEPSK